MTDPALAALLEVQAADITTDQLGHRRATLPSKAALADEEAAMTAIDADLEPRERRSADLRRSQRRLEDEIATVETKAAAEDATLYSGTVRSPRELQALQQEVASLRKRARALEDDLLEILEESETLDAELARLHDRRAGHATAAEGLRVEVVEDEAGVAEELSATAARREEAAGHVPGDLLATYATLRRRLDGVAVARLEGNRCGGCHLTLPATEVDAVRRAPPGEVVRHEECGRILVRIT